MGNGIGKIGVCFTGQPEARCRPDSMCMPGDDGLGHSFCYVRPDPARLLNSGLAPPPSSKIHSEESSAGGSSIFRSISGASVSANTSTPPSTAATAADTMFSAAFFESSTSFASVPLQPIPRSGPLSGPLCADHGFMSGPIDRSGGFMSGPLERAGPIFSGPLDRSFSVHGGGGGWRRSRPGGSFIRTLRRAISKTFGPTSMVAPVKSLGAPNYFHHHLNNHNNINDNTNINYSEGMMKSGSRKKRDELIFESENIEWAQGKAGEDRVHVVVSEEFGWVFVGIYDGFNGPDATDFLLSNLYSSVQKQLKGLLWDDHSNSPFSSSNSINPSENPSFDVVSDRRSSGSSKKSQNLSSRRNSNNNKKWEENQRRWKCEWDRERVELDRRLREQWSSGGVEGEKVDHNDVLNALSEALLKTEKAYLDIADMMLDENPELSLMGSCVLAMLMKGEDVYVMNVGDSRAVLGRNKEPDLRLGMIDHDLERINEESLYDFDVSDGVRCNLSAIQLSVDHSTSVEEEVQRIRDEHPDDPFAVSNDRVKGSLKVTRAFGAGFLKQKKWNDALLEMFRIDYVGTSPYINCLPFLYHHRLGPKDQFLILSSDGLYQYFTNEEAVSEVELFISLSPDGDPAQHLVEEVLFRAAKRAGLDFYELLEIPQGDRRRYHDDVSIIVISFEGRIWRSCV
ncbi:hypothetical protein RND81_05G268100 [Saponaria officinalis]|uniref:protein-serine/threonine phosphatase n=1 Tax=Saponaria officinalis TaxID=3572 RepID=A0AAW1L2S8_SAPOF